VPPIDGAPVIGGTEQQVRTATAGLLQQLNRVGIEADQGVPDRARAAVSPAGIWSRQAAGVVDSNEEYRKGACMSSLSGFALATLVAVGVVTQQSQQPQFPVDKETGRAIGAHEMTVADVAHALETNRKVVVIDVREPDSFAKETIKGAINIPIGQLDARLNDFSKDTLLVFT
jgi:hypothetical protein